ncbi:MAG: hypothetical protein COA79_25680 [Planctomycetota bacterium]|nr:MAG: hypothetical protein COA79_25680 [Planctomycetota bacterium]
MSGGRAIALCLHHPKYFFAIVNHTMKALENRDESYNSVLVSIKKALDPNNILSPGKYIPLAN